MRRDRLQPPAMWDETLALESLRFKIRQQLPPAQARVARALLVTGHEFEAPERPVTYPIVALALRISVATVREHLRRIRRRHPLLYADLMAERRRRLDAWHADVAARRLERSRRWGKARWASAYRGQHGSWPWDDLAGM